MLETKRREKLFCKSHTTVLHKKKCKDGTWKIRSVVSSFNAVRAYTIIGLDICPEENAAAVDFLLTVRTSVSFWL